MELQDNEAVVKGSSHESDPRQPDTKREVTDYMRRQKEKVRRHAEIAREYNKQQRESECFDIDVDVVPEDYNVFKFVVPYEPEDGDGFPAGQICIAALSLYNNDDNNMIKYEFHKFAYATASFGCGTYYLTFLATPKPQISPKTLVSDFFKMRHQKADAVVFEAKVCFRSYNLLTPPLIPYFCRIKAPPRVKEVEIVGDAVEGNVVKGVGHYLGGNQGPSKFEWFRVMNGSSSSTDMRAFLAASTEYTVTREDVGHCLLFSYTPVSSVGLVGKPESTLSEIVVGGRNPLSGAATVSNGQQAPPRVEEVKIVGDAVVGNVVKGVCHYLGGNQGPSKFEWFRVMNGSSSDMRASLAASTEYTVTREDVGHRLLFSYTPVSSVGVVGKPESTLSEIVEGGRNPLSGAAIVSNGQQAPTLSTEEVIV